MERMKFKLHIDELNKAYDDLKTSTPPDGCDNKKGWEQLSNDGSYLVKFYMEPSGDIELEVRPPYGSYSLLNELNYNTVEELTK